MLRTLFLSAFLAAWLATGILAGIVMSPRRRDRFPWWLLGVALGALIVPLTLGAEHGEQPTGRASSPKRRRTSPFQSSLPSTTPSRRPRRWRPDSTDAQRRRGDHGACGSPNRPGRTPAADAGRTGATSR